MGTHASSAGLTEMLYEVRDGVATVTFNRPDRMNGWTRTMERELRVAVDRAAADPDVRVIVLTGAGRAFCVGADVGRLKQASASDAGSPSAAPAPARDARDQRYTWMLSVPKPMIAAINGAVAGVGFCLTLFCDLRYMADGAKLSTSFSRRGLIAEHGSAWLLPRLIGPMNAADLLFSGRTVTAAEAQGLGLVRMLDADGFAERVRAKAVELATFSSPRSVRIIKAQLMRGRDESIVDATRFADEQATLCRGSEDFKEGVASFAEKRTPAFTGR
jgi:enoyl-CoA hydratase/carnithine racemase